ncbi:MAG: HDOD domain-containing protein [Methylophagaceae bacterium]
MQQKISELFNQINNIPRIPEIVKTLISHTNNPNVEFDDIAKDVEKEQVISMKVLRLVNSAHFGLSRKIGSINQALVLLGISELRKLVITSGIVESVPHIPSLDINEFWLDSFRTATYAKWLADESKLDNSDMIYTAGLIHQLGTILIHLGNHDAANDIDEAIYQGNSQANSERQRLGFTSNQACAELCRQWQFPEELASTVEKAAEPTYFETLSLSACAVFIANYISKAGFEDLDNESIITDFPMKEWQLLGFTEEQITNKLTKILDLDTGIEGLLD